MNIRNIFRRMNRGLVLAGLLLIGLMVYLVAENIRFRSEVAVIEQTILDFAAETENLMVLPESAQKPGEPASDDVVEAKIAESEAVLRKYLSNNAVSRWSTAAYDRLSWGQRDCLVENQRTRAYITACHYSITEVKNIQKISPSLASADISFKMTVEAIGSASYLMLFTTEYNGGYYGYYSDVGYSVNQQIPADEEMPIDTETHNFSRQCSIEGVYLRKVDGAWKICEANNISWR